MFWKFRNLSWQDPDHRTLSLVMKTLRLPVGHPRGDLRNPGITPCLLASIPTLDSKLSAHQVCSITGLRHRL